jgi:hypothetical protein
MAHPLKTVHDLLTKYAPPCSAKETALVAVESMLVHADHDERACVECGATYYLTPNQREFFRSRKLPEPRRCVPCREARRRGLQQRGALE